MAKPAAQTRDYIRECSAASVSSSHQLQRQIARHIAGRPQDADAWFRSRHCAAFGVGDELFRVRLEQEALLH